MLVLTGLCTALLGGVNVEESTASISVAQQSASRSPQSAAGRLDPTSPVLEDDGSYYATHSFEGTAGETLAIQLTSDDFNAFLGLLNPSGERIAADDDGAGGTNSLIVITLPTTGTYTIVANTYAAGEVGEYQVEWRTATDTEQALALANQLIEQAGDLYGAGRHREAIPLAERALAISEAQLGPDHLSTATNLNNLAELYRSMGRYEEAEPLYQRALAIREAQLGPNHPSTAISFNNLAALYQSMRRYEDAESLYQRALAIHEAQMGADHPNTVNILNNLSALSWVQGQLQPTLSYLQQGLIAEETVLSRNLLGGSDGNKRDYLATVSGSTSVAIGLHLNDLPANTEAAHLALTTILQRKGRILDLFTNLRAQLADDPTALALLDDLSAATSQLSNLTFNPPPILSPQDQQSQLQSLQQRITALEDQLSLQTSLPLLVWRIFRQRSLVARLWSSSLAINPTTPRLQHRQSALVPTAMPHMCCLLTARFKDSIWVQPMPSMQQYVPSPPASPLLIPLSSK